MVPLLFNIFLNNLLLDFKTTEICNFADDNTLYKGDKNLKFLNNILKSGITEVLEWFRNNSLVANPEKFQILLLSPKAKMIEKFTISIDGNTLCNTQTVKLLGITIDSNLTFKNHITNLCISAKNKLKALQRIRKYLTLDQTKMIANAFIYSQFNYCNIIWMFCSKMDNDQIENVQKRALRCVYQEDNVTFEYLKDKYQEFSIHEKNIQSLMFFIYRVINNLSPELVSDSFKEKTTKYSLRSNSTLQLPRLGKTTRFGINTVIFKGSLLWNYLPNLYKDNKTESTFKEKNKK